MQLTSKPDKYKVVIENLASQTTQRPTRDNDGYCVSIHRHDECQGRIDSFKLSEIFKDT
jgi:hypothetical protein